ncbi:MAG: SusC/RagA family TonB-linked outer membrane protein [Paludibacter sp.]|nr:SusC/RagA family TonB-linked outer membrane protein [Paludibacter sp.]
MKYTYSKKRLCLYFLLLVNLLCFAQQPNFSGSVRDEAGQPIIGALVTIKENSKFKVFSDQEGKFEIPGEKGQTLEITTVDQLSKSLRLVDTKMSITMGGSHKLIPIGYGMELRKEEITSSIGLVDAEELNKISAINPANTLYGKIPGLTVLQTGGTDWNNNPTLYIRGVETFGIGGFTNTNLLTLVDGFEQPISSLSMSEIESVVVLKDAAALAMYGMRGANGVIRITTKKGNGKNLSVNVNYEHGITKAFRLPDLLNSYDYANAVNQARANDGLIPLYSQSMLNKYKSGESPYLFPNVNWLNECLNEFGMSNKFNISFQQQAGSVRHFTVLNYENETGLLKPVNLNSGYNTQIGYYRFNFRTNIDIDLTKTTKFSVNLAGNLSSNSRPSTANSESDIFYTMYNTPSLAFPVKTRDNIWGGSTTYTTNPVALISSQGYNVQGNTEISTNFILKQRLDKIIKGLSAEAGYSYNKSYQYVDVRSKQYQYQQVNPVIDPASGVITDSAATLYGSNTALGFSHYVLQQRQRTTALLTLKYGTAWDNNVLNSNIILQSDELALSGQNNTYRHLLAAGNVHYSKAGKYFADFSLSYNGTNILPTTSRFGLFPAVSVAWKLSNEKWLVESLIVNDLKIRASWGLSGNDQVMQNISMSTIVGGSGYYFNVNNLWAYGFAEGRLASTPTFETSNKSNIGLDATLFKMLDLTADAFYNKRTGILVDATGTTSGVIGAYVPYSSTGIVENKGFEVGINLHNNKDNFSYHIGGQLSFARNKIINMDEGYQPEAYLKRTGHSIGQAFGLQSIGFFKDAADISASPKQTFSIVRPGDIKYKDQNNDGIINSYDQIPLGYSTLNPEFYFSGFIGCEYKGFGFDALIQGTANQTVYLNAPTLFWPLRGNMSITHFSDNAWTPANASTATLPRLSMSENANNYQPNSTWLTNGSYLKLRSVQLYYNLPKQLLSNIKIKNVRFYVEGLNLLSIDNIKCVDPEAIWPSNPTLSTFLFGAQIGF